MILNYLKLAFRVLANKKFFTFISLFGISITLMVLMVFTSFVESQISNNPPMSDKDKMIFVNRVTLRQMVQDTTLTIDTSYDNSIAVYDTTYAFNESNRSTSTSSLSHHFLNTYMRDLENVENYSFHSTGNTFDIFVNNTKVALDAIYADAAYFEIFDFVFTEGAPWASKAFENQEQVAVITQKAAIKYFGEDENIVGRELLMDGKHYKIVGMVNTPPASLNYLRSDVYIPYTNMDPTTFDKDSYMGGFRACFVGNKTSDLPLIKEQIAFKASKLEPLGDNWHYNRSEATGETFGESYALNIIPGNDGPWAKKVLLAIVSSLILLFILLPVLNLIKINVSRIMDRSIEIGVRKAFGANQRDIMMQFVFENVVLTVLGGVIGFILTFILIRIFNETQALGPVTLFINYRMVIYSLLVTLGFGIFSGLLPAFKMSKIHIVNAINQNNL